MIALKCALLRLETFTFGIFCCMLRGAVCCAILTLMMFTGVASIEAAVLNITVTQPWLALVVSFIGGANVEVNSLQTWDNTGRLIQTKRGKTLHDLSPETYVIALDYEDAKSLGLELTRPGLRILYSPFPIPADNIDTSMTDPSVLPFIAQRVMTALSMWDPTSYTYYQRRLAEFQARLSSSVLAGRQVLRGIAICDMTGNGSALLQAAGCQLERPDMMQLESWAKSDKTRLRNFVDARKTQNSMIVIDDSTPKILRAALENQQGVFLMQRPPLDKDYPSFLHDQYLSLWQKIIAKPLPGKK